MCVDFLANLRETPIFSRLGKEYNRHVAHCGMLLTVLTFEQKGNT